MSPVISFKSGGSAATDILIHSGQELIYRSSKPESVDLFSYLSPALKIEPKSYNELVIKVGATSQDRMDFWLKVEIVTEDGETIPLVFSIDEPFTLHVKHDVYVISDNTRMLDLMNVRADVLVSDITMDMIMSAQRVDNVIRISREWNPDLYVKLLDRLSTITNISLIVDNTGGPTTRPSSTPVPAPTAAM